MSKRPIPDRPHQIVTDQLVQDLAVDIKTGLSADEAHTRLRDFGPNALQETKRESVLMILLRQFTGVIVYILVVAAGISFFLGDTVEGFAIIAVLLINAITGFVLEWNARQSMDALRKLDSTPARVLRDGRVREIASEDVTIGDVLVVEAGDLVAADANLFQVSQLQIDESALTGESLPVDKTTELAAEDAPWAINTTDYLKEHP
ncbi:HAD-IC family P-type ATPase [Spirosoma sp. KNUC1025]|uniref:HAD-IC family P-type ATPase n=1 Tax=Spirosoma sp. KNUC1025 TaxID=2894082 RepID=UPI003869C3AA